MNTATAAPSASDARWKWFQRQLRKLRGKPLRFTIEVKPTFDALLNSTTGPHALELLLACGRSALTGGDRECFGCARRWDEDRVVVAMGHVVLIDLRDTAGLIGLCHDCWVTLSPSKLMAAAFKRDFQLTTIAVQPLSKGSRA